MEKNKWKTSHLIRSTAVFVAVAFVIQLVFILLFTPEGLTFAYPLYARLKSEKIEEDNSFAEYYDIKSDFADKGFYLIGGDVNVSATYSVVLDYLRFAKKSFEIETVLLPIGTNTAKKVNEILTSDVTGYETLVTEMADSGIYTNEFITFVRGLYKYNGTLSPKRKLTVSGYSVDTVSVSAITKMTNTVLSKWTSQYSTDIYSIITKVKPDDFFDHFDSFEEDFRAFLGEDDFNYYKEIESHYREGDYLQWKFTEKIKLYLDTKFLCVVSDEYLNLTLVDYLDSTEKEWCATRICYSKCQTLDKSHKAVDKDGTFYPFVSAGEIRFVSAESTKPFYDRFLRIATYKEYFDYSTDSFYYGNFFIVGASEASSFPEKEEVATNG